MIIKNIISLIDLKKASITEITEVGTSESTGVPGVNKSYKVTLDDKTERNENYIICKVCGVRLKGLFSHLFWKHKMSSIEYKQLFPNAQLFCKEYLNKIGRANSIALRGHSYPNKLLRKTVNCLFCQKEIIVSINSTQKFCSRKCLSNYQRGAKEEGRDTKRRASISLSHRMMPKEKHSNWQGGKSYEPYTIDFDKEIKQLVLELRGNTCFLCGSNEGVVCIHHIDYNKQNSNDITNLIPLCRSCHMKTNYNRGYWKNFFKNFANLQVEILDDTGKVEKFISIKRMVPLCRI